MAEHGSSAYADAEYWDRYFAGHREAGTDLDWEGTWTSAFLPRLVTAGLTSVLELGCGTGNDAARLAREEIDVVAVDFSGEAIAQAERKFAHLGIRFLVGDIAEPLDFEDGAFDAVMSNVALHMFPDAVTRAAFAEIERVVRHGGLFLCHVNALEDRPLRERRRPVRRELEPNYVLEEAGQTVRFFSREYLTDLLDDWQYVELQLIDLRDRATGEPFKCVWRVIARRR